MFPATPKSPLRPLDRQALDRQALAYVARFATTRAKLTAHLRRKVEQRGWAGPGIAPIDEIVARVVALGYIDDAQFARARATALARRGYGRRRVAAALSAAGIDADDAAAAMESEPEADEDPAFSAALTFARRRRIGPYASVPADDTSRRRAFAAMMRAGHDPDVARRILAISPGASATFQSRD